MRNRISAVLALILSAVVRLSAIEWEYVNATFLFGFYNNASIGSGSDALEPSPVHFSPGVSIFYRLPATGDIDSFYIQPGLQFYWTIEGLKDGIPRSVGPESSAHMQVSTISLDFPFGYLFNFGKLRLGVQAGAVLDLSFPLVKAQAGTAEPEMFWKAYYETVRFMKLSFGSWLDFPVSEVNRFTVGLGITYPLANFWTRAPLDHGVRFNLAMTIPISLRK